VKELSGDFWRDFADRLVNSPAVTKRSVPISMPMPQPRHGVCSFDFNCPMPCSRSCVEGHGFKAVTAVRTLKFDDAGFDIWHWSFVYSAGPPDRAGPPALPVPNSIFCQDGVFSVPRTKHRSGRKEAFLFRL
jgi:hypothetical protein